MADLLKWSLSVGAVRSFSSHAINTEEIEALITPIGESSEALKRVYAISDITTQIRLLASTYSAMQDSDIRVFQTSALDELNSLVASLSVEDLDQQLLENLCVDLFPVLPDSAVSLLERIQTKRQSVGLFDAAINTIRETTRKLAESEQPESEVPAVFEVFKSKWINATSVEDLNSGLERLYSTRAKEEFIRRWCLTNRGNDDLSQVISTWLDVIIGDAEYTVPMKSLRQVCELMVNVTPLKRTELIDRLHIPEFIALRSPKQEWVRIRFALAEACRELEPERAQQEVLDTFQTILADHDDLDVGILLGPNAAGCETGVCTRCKAT